VRLKRFAAPRCVFSLIFFTLPIRFLYSALRRGRRGGFGPAAARRLAAQDRVHLVALEPRHRLGNRDVGELVDQPLENAPADLRMRHLAAAEEDRRLHLVAVLEEALDVLLLELVVVLVDLRAELDLLDLDHFLVLARFTRPFLLLVLVLPEVHDPADRRDGGRRNFHQVEPLGLGDRQRLWRRHDAQLLAGVVDHADFTDADSLVHPHAIVAAGSSVECDKASYAVATVLPLSAISSRADATNASIGRAP